MAERKQKSRKSWKLHLVIWLVLGLPGLRAAWLYGAASSGAREPPSPSKIERAARKICKPISARYGSGAVLGLTGRVLPRWKGHFRAGSFRPQNATFRRNATSRGNFLWCSSQISGTLTVRVFRVGARAFLSQLLRAARRA